MVRDSGRITLKLIYRKFEKVIQHIIKLCVDNENLKKEPSFLIDKRLINPRLKETSLPIVRLMPKSLNPILMRRGYKNINCPLWPPNVL